MRPAGRGLVAFAFLVGAAACGPRSGAGPEAAPGPAGAHAPEHRQDRASSPAQSEATTAKAAAAAPGGALEPDAATSGPAPRVAPPAPAPHAACASLVNAGREAIRGRGEDGAIQAIELYRRALDTTPGCAEALWELGWALQLRGDHDGALAAWTELRAVAPGHPELEQHLPLLVMRRDQAHALAVLPDPGALPPPETTPRPGPTLTFAAVGDVQLGRAWPPEKAALPPADARPLFVHAAPVLSSADVAFGNLETALADSGDSHKCGKTSRACFAFRAPTAYAATLAAAGFDVMSNANNHAGDFGAAGRESTRAALDGAGILHSGAVGDIASLERKGLRIALIAFATGGDMFRVQDVETARKLVADAGRRHDLVVVSFHAGAEGAAATRVPRAREVFLREDRGDVYAFAHAVVDAGADLVLGHGPHVLRAMELYQGRLIAYSLGNFTAWRSFSLVGPLGVTGILEATLAPNGVLVAARLVPMRLEGEGIPTPDPDGAAVRAVRELSVADLGASVLDARGVYERSPAALAADP